MEYLIEFSKLVKKQLKKLDRNIQITILKKINKLKENPINNKNHIKNNFYEFYYKNYRIYYQVLRGLIIIERIRYEGKEIVVQIGTKNSQRKDISKL